MFNFYIHKNINSFVAVAGFEPATPWSQTRCATGLRHIPILIARETISCFSRCEDRMIFFKCKNILKQKYSQAKIISIMKKSDFSYHK